MTETETAPAETRSRAPALGAILPRTWLQLVAGVAAMLFLGGSIAYVALTSADRPPRKGSVDVGFLYDMIAHHEQALQMANIEMANGSTPAAQVFAREILLFQAYEIGLMDRQLDRWGYQRGNPPAQAMTWMGMPVAHDDMPGMASAEEMDRLSDVAGTETDALFIALMKDHHAGGVHMAQYAAEHARDQFVRDLARRMARNQRIEIAELDAARERAGLPRAPTGYEPDTIAQHGEGGR